MDSNEDSKSEVAIYMLQTIKIQGRTLNIFFDSGCGDLVCKKNEVNFLESIGRARKVLDGPLTLAGVGDHKTTCEHGVYNIKIPLHNGKDASLTGICLDKITGEFPSYPLKVVENDIKTAYMSKSNDVRKLPKLPKSVGGETDLMIGIQYLRYYPKKIFSLPTGLTIYESQFLNSDGTRGLVGGPHKVFTEIHKNLKGTHLSMSAYLNKVVQVYQNGFSLSIDVPLLGTKNFELNESDKLSNKSEYILCSDVFINRKQPKILSRFEEVENAGSEVSYRCVRCRGLLRL